MRSALLLGIALLAGSPAADAGTKLDDSASPKQRIDVRTRWLHEGEGLNNPERLNALVAEIPGLEVRLNTSAYLGKKGRIYLVMPNFVQGMRSTSGMRVEWKARGNFLSGSASPGGRALVFDGTISRPMTGDTLDVVIHLDARYAEAGIRFDPIFEIDEVR